jgi:hypothetical protein
MQIYVNCPTSLSGAALNYTLGQYTDKGQLLLQTYLMVQFQKVSVFKKPSSVDPRQSSSISYLYKN